MPAIEEDQYHLHICLAQARRANYEKAASLRGQALQQWAISHLDESARFDIKKAVATSLSPKGFDDFCRMLDAPMPEATQKLLSRKPIWE